MRCLHIVYFLIFTFPSSLFSQICDFSYRSNENIERYTEGYVHQFFQNPARPRTVVRIPVVVHVVWQNEFQNISDAQVQSQIDALNRDFRKRNTINPIFLRFAVDCEIEFCLARRDTNGNPTSGIERRKTDMVNIGSSYFDSSSRRRIFYTSKQGLNVWQPKKYFNIWVCAFDGLLGLASSPAQALVRPEEDGIVVDYRAFGTIGSLQVGRQGGRIAVHETGHYFNLLHIWGKDSTCDDDDEVEDTPRQEGPHDGCPTDLLKSCSNSLDYFRNYMDYTNDDCMSFFTAGQKARMWAALTSSRASLTTSNACDPVAVTHIYMPTFDVYPNPAQSFLTIDLKNWGLNSPKKVRLTDCLGSLMSEKTFYTEGVSEFALDGFPNGIYFLLLNVDNQNFTKKIVVNR
jgi:Pregnancy-associated plasma protein-A/Secretion system C-terminal sorting domain